jgi:hypothetical protein
MVSVKILAPGLEPVQGEHQTQGYQAGCRQQKTLFLKVQCHKIIDASRKRLALL